MSAPAGTPSRILLTGLAGMGAAFLAIVLAHGTGGILLWLAALTAWLLLWLANQLWSAVPERAPTALARAGGIGIPFLFGFTLLFLWEVICVGLKVPTVLLPPPSMIGARLMGSLPTLGADFVQTVIRAVIPGWIMGSLAGFLIALLCDRFGFLRRGLMPIGNFISALPIIGIAPILVMWFGFDWQSKAAVVVVMTFFPMLVNTVAGLASAGHLERDLMRSYGASWSRRLLALRLPAAMPFIFNALKINATLAMIGAIVAEFFGTPIVGMGFRISTEVGRMAVDMVWATIAIAAIAGSSFYALLVLAERRVTFWHPSNRQK
ncbi:MAG: ABC transporter permease [Beijerinckiaceae bacterium]|nr:ABC transporter permease [Beijerinckiaceae bacterium]